MIQKDTFLNNCIIIALALFLITVIPGVCGENIQENIIPGSILFKLTDLPENTEIYRISLMKTGNYYQDGRVHQIQNTSFIRDSKELIWNPCNENSCSYASFPTSGGNNGPGELMMEITLINPAVDVQSCHGDTTCERLKGAVSTKSGMLDGVFTTGESYEVSVSSLRSGIGQQFTVTRIT